MRALHSKQRQQQPHQIFRSGNLGYGKILRQSKPEYTAPDSKYDTLVWADEFDGDSVDESKWNIIDGMANHAAIYNKGAVSIVKDGDESCLAIKLQKL